MEVLEQDMDDKVTKVLTEMRESEKKPFYESMETAIQSLMRPEQYNE